LGTWLAINLVPTPLMGENREIIFLCLYENCGSGEMSGFLRMKIFAFIDVDILLKKEGAHQSSHG